MEFDAELKSWGANPGSLADLMCASVFTSTLDAAAPKPVDS
jgi:triphosphoribosyl-dephospho-CoA synthetase